MFFLSSTIVLLFVLHMQCKCNTKKCYVGSAGNEVMHESTVSEEERVAMPGPSGTCVTVTDGRCCSGLTVVYES